MVRGADFSNPGKDADLNIAKGPCLAGKRSVAGRPTCSGFASSPGASASLTGRAGSLSAADFGPVGGPGSSEARALAKGQDRVRCVATLLIVRQLPFRQSEGTRGPNPGQGSGIVDRQRRGGGVSWPHELVPRRDRPCGGGEAESAERLASGGAREAAPASRGPISCGASTGEENIHGKHGRAGPGQALLRGALRGDAPLRSGSTKVSAIGAAA